MGPTSLAGVCVVIPTYNESANIVRLARRLRALSPDLRILVIDDSSPDNTGTLAEEASHLLQPMNVIRRFRKEGRGSACLLGFAAALQDPETRVIVEMDADFSHDPAELPATVETTKGADVVIRSRYLPGSRIVDWSFSRRLFSRCANALARLLLNVKLTDYTNGYRAYSREAAAAIQSKNIGSSGYIVLSEIAEQLHAKGFRFVELPSVFVNRSRGKSNLGLSEIVGATVGIVRLAWTTRPR